MLYLLCTNCPCSVPVAVPPCAVPAVPAGVGAVLRGVSGTDGGTWRSQTAVVHLPH